MSLPTESPSLEQLLRELNRPATWIGEVFTHSAPPSEWFSAGIAYAPLQRLSDELGGDPEFVRELLITYIDTLPPILQSIREGIASSDQAMAKRGAHTLKGSSVNVGAYRITALAIRLGELIGLGSFSEAQAMLPLLSREHDRVKQEIPAIQSALS